MGARMAPGEADDVHVRLPGRDGVGHGAGAFAEVDDRDDVPDPDPAVGSRITEHRIGRHGTGRAHSAPPRWATVAEWEPARLCVCTHSPAATSAVTDPMTIPDRTTPAPA